MKLSKMFPSRWLASDDLAGHTPTVTIRAITVERVGAPPQDEDKYVMWFRGKDKGLILNKTNGVSVSQMYGDETDNWMGKDIQLYTTKVKAFGAVHDAIRVRSAGTVSAAPMPEQEAEPEDLQDWGDDDPVPESLADGTADTAAAYVLTQPPLPDPPTFGTVKKAMEWAVDFGAYDDSDAAKVVYNELKAQLKPKNAGEMYAAWIAHCRKQIPPTASDPNPA